MEKFCDQKKIGRKILRPKNVSAEKKIGQIFFSRPRKIKVIILKPIYPSKFLTKDNPSKEEIQKATKKMTEFLENQIKEKTKLLYG